MHAKVCMCAKALKVTHTWIGCKRAQTDTCTHTHARPAGGDTVNNEGGGKGEKTIISVICCINTALRQSIESFFAADSQEYKGPAGNKKSLPDVATSIS